MLVDSNGEFLLGGNKPKETSIVIYPYTVVHFDQYYHVVFFGSNVCIYEGVYSVGDVLNLVKGANYANNRLPD